MLNWVMLFASLLVAEDSSARSGRVQPQSPRAGAAAEESPGLDLGIEFRRDRFRYRFENPSSFNTSFPVPHFFEQSYRVDTRWLDLRGRYRVLGRLWETEVGLTPDTTGSGDDYDTFFNPDGNLIVYGTRADVSIRSWRFRHSIALTRVAGFDTWIGYSIPARSCSVSGELLHDHAEQSAVVHLVLECRSRVHDLGCARGAHQCGPRRPTRHRVARQWARRPHAARRCAPDHASAGQVPGAADRLRGTGAVARGVCFRESPHRPIQDRGLRGRRSFVELRFGEPVPP